MLILIVYLPEKLFFLVHIQNDRTVNYKTGKVEPILSN